MNGCIEWRGAATRAGYGIQKIPGTRKNILVHRKAYIEAFGEIPDGLFVCHKCDNPRCVNPEHLFLGTPKDNVHDMISKGRRVVGRPKFGAENNLTRLPDSVVAEIRSATGSLAKVAEQFGISKSHAHRIRNGLARKQA